MKKKSGFKVWSKKVRRSSAPEPVFNYTFTPEQLKAGVCRAILDFEGDILNREFSRGLLDYSLYWARTLQGHAYWRSRAEKEEPMTDYDWEFLTQALRKMKETYL